MSAWCKAKKVLMPWLRRILCLILCVSLLFSAPAPKAEAVVAESAIAIGAIACLILMSVGVVFKLKTQEDLVAIGQNFQSYMYQWGTEAQKLDEVEEMFNGLRLIDPDDDGDWSPNETKISLARTLLAGISAWCGSFLLGISPPILSSSYTPSDYTVTYSLVPSYSSYGDAYLYTPSMAETITSSIPVTFDGKELSVSTKHEKLASVCMCSSGFTLSDGYYTINSSSVVLTNPSFSSKTFAWGVLRYDPSDGSYTWVTSKSYNISRSSNNGISFALVPLTFYASSSYLYHVAVAFSGKVDSLDQPMGLDFGETLSLIPSDDTSTSPVIVGDYADQLENGALLPEQLPIYNLDISQALPPGTPVLKSIQTLGDWLTANELTLEEYQTMTKGAADPVWEKSIEFGSSITYQQNAVADPIEVLAWADDKGEILYEWHMYGQDADGNNFSALPVGEGPSIVPYTAEPGIYNYYCKAMNRNLAGYYSHPIFTYSLTVTVTPTSVEPDPGTDPDPGVDPDPAPDPEPGVDSDLSGDIAAGEDFVSDLMDVIPNYHEGFSAALRDFSNSFSYEGTAAVMTIPALRLPEIPGKTKDSAPLLKSYELLPEQKVDFADYVEIMPETVLLLVRCLLTGALILYCCKELYDVIAYILTLRKGD